jgi:hypothetical protein
VPKEIPGYHYRSGPEGVIAIQSDEPYEGAVTFTWKPSKDFPGDKVEAVIPQALFATCAVSYIRELNALKAKVNLHGTKTEESART